MPVAPKSRIGTVLMGADPPQALPNAAQLRLDELIADTRPSLRAREPSAADFIGRTLMAIGGEPRFSSKLANRLAAPIELGEVLGRQSANLGSAVGRIGAASVEGAKDGLNVQDPLGLDPSTVQALRDAGVFSSGDETLARPFQSLNEIMLRGGTAVGDALIRGMGATAKSGARGFGQTLQELGASQGMSRRATRDALMFLESSGLRTLAAPGASIGKVLMGKELRVREGLLGAPPRPAAIPGRDAILLPKGPVNTRGRQRTSSLQDAKRVFSEVLDTKQSAVGKLFREDIGDITIDFGRVGDPNKAFRRGFGLAKILAKRSAEGIDAEQFVRITLPRLVSEGKLTRLEGPSTSRRAIIELGDDIAIFSLFRGTGKGKDLKIDRETWLLTGFRKRE